MDVHRVEHHPNWSDMGFHSMGFDKGTRKENHFFGGSKQIYTNGYESNLNRNWTAGVAPYFHTPGFHFGYLFSTHTHLVFFTPLNGDISVWFAFRTTTNINHEETYPEQDLAGPEGRGHKYVSHGEEVRCSEYKSAQL